MGSQWGIMSLVTLTERSVYTVYFCICPPPQTKSALQHSVNWPVDIIWKRKKKKTKNKKGHTQIFSIFCPMIIPLFIGAFWALWVHNSTFEGTVGVQKLTCSKGYCNVPVWCTFVLQKVQFCSTFSESERYF